MLLLQQAAEHAVSPLAGTSAEWLWLIPLLPLLGFVINGALSLFPATKFGPADPNSGHDHGEAGGHEAGHSDGQDHGHDDHGHPVRHRFATVSSIVGPAVLVLA